MNVKTWAKGDVSMEGVAENLKELDEIDVVARPATDDEFEAVFAAGGSIYGGYTKYRERVDGRDIRVFVLEQA